MRELTIVYLIEQMLTRSSKALSSILILHISYIYLSDFLDVFVCVYAAVIYRQTSNISRT